MFKNLVEDVDEGIVSSRGHNHTMASGKRSPDLKTVARDIKEVIRKSFVVSTHQAATEMPSRTGSPASKKLTFQFFSGWKHK